uniref:Uncharacterized protein n=1 Tax=Gadus morhua TaxID=8049 RepID=A0A8C5FV93_GADMO
MCARASQPASLHVCASPCPSVCECVRVRAWRVCQSACMCVCVRGCVLTRGDRVLILHEQRLLQSTGLAGRLIHPAQI